MQSAGVYSEDATRSRRPSAVTVGSCWVGASELALPWAFTKIGRTTVP